MGLTDSEKIALLNLLDVPGLGSGLAIRLVREFGQPSRVYEAGDGALRTVPRLGERVIEGIRKSKPDAAAGVQQYEAASRVGAQIIGYWDDEYPALLKEIEQDAPAVLFVRGSLKASATRVAFVGTRRASDYGKRMCREIIGGLAASGVHVVSGLASGIDGAAHQAALEKNLITEAVFGCGIDTIYPDSHKALAEQILSANGALISEYAPGVEPTAYTFPQRNRIIAGLSSVTIVVEAPERSGALITARQAGSFGREVGAIPGFVIGGKATGCHELIKEGAALVDSAQDILDMLQLKTRAVEQVRSAPKPDLPEADAKLWELVPTDDKIHIDALVERTSQGAGEVLSRLLMLELKGFIKQLPGKYFVRA